MKINESKLNKIISESIKKVLKESDECPNCGAHSHGNKCSYCGTLKNKGNCKNCGAPLDNSGKCAHCGDVLKESKDTNEVVLQSVDTEYFKTSKTANPIYKVCGETLDGEEFCGYTSPNASCAYVCRGLSSEHLRRKQQYLKVTYHFTPKGIKSIDFLDFIEKY